jgi:uncharacterized protein (TIGR02996 family)
MFSDELLADILRSPHDDAPRLVYADWLQDHGDLTRAEFVRVQCQLAASPVPVPHLQQREQELLARHGWEWAAADVGAEGIEWVFRRGFIERVGLYLERSTAELLHILHRAPILYVRDYSQMCKLSGLIGALPHLSHLEGLELWWLYSFDQQLVRELLLSPHLAGLKTLILHHDRNGSLVRDEVLVDGLHSPHRSRLEELAVNVDGSWRGPSEAVLDAIASSPYLRQLRKLDISNAQPTEEALERLLASPNLEQLEELDLRAVRAPRAAWELLRDTLPAHVSKLWMADAGLLDSQGGWLREPPGWREPFVARVDWVDWETRYRDPVNGGVWMGQSWEGRKREMLLSIQDHLRERDPDGLEVTFRELSQQWSQPGDTERIEELDLDGWGAQVGERMRQVSASGPQSLVLRLDEHVSWRGELHVYAQAAPVGPLEQHEAYQEMGYAPSSAILPMPTPPEVEGALLRCRRLDPLGPHGPELYLRARLVASISRHLPEVPCPVYVSCRGLFRLR